ncbi:RsmB/NOP family class I SAM-dependent RNA methyltransferase [Sphingomicrobium lutaoense]|uniref:16S rRNA (Cytosine967-C5)-methyltransferase n=1 Tax=Sphingomicrobium lutaoense TaxID=515949 RepID=A0A839Z0N0_9SPHN|nr:RsmB/NOP family class I SAM-dependent RNA methyltransferase [Sphingomicrobium lutaoense]MBB3763607.1 16S rRNA (cytosine967-C5)-methyltransferase [Sphingomicrobium lutaoense]
MTPGARIQAAIEILDEVIASARDNGPPADAIVRRYFKARRYAGSKDRRAVRELVFAAIRRSGSLPDNGRTAMLGLAADDAEIAALFTGEGHAPAAIGAEESAAPRQLIPDAIAAELSPLVSEAEWPALLERAPLDLRVHATRTRRDAMLKAIPEAEPTPISSLGLRLPAESRIDSHPAYRDGLVEVQDEASQIVIQACQPEAGMLIVDLCAGAGGKSLALAAQAPSARIVASDTNRARLSQLPARAERARSGNIETRLLDMPREAEQLADLEVQADLVLVDAPCSGSGTWRRNPEGRWRLTPERLDRLVETQGRLIDLAVPLLKPGARLVYAVCSILEKEGSGQIEQAASRYSQLSWQDEMNVGRKAGKGRLLTPGHDGTDGFFFAAARKTC